MPYDQQLAKALKTSGARVLDLFREMDTNGDGEVRSSQQSEVRCKTSVVDGRSLAVKCQPVLRNVKRACLAMRDAVIPLHCFTGLT